MTQAATVEEDGVSWIDESGTGPCQDQGLESSNLSPAEVHLETIMIQNKPLA